MIEGETMSEKLILPPASGLCPACSNGAANHHQASNTIAKYCPHNQALATMNLNGDARLWTIFTPIREDQWSEILMGAATIFRVATGAGSPTH